jgi:hypothetical protein
MRQLPIGPKSATWHLVQCSCGWARKYVSRYRAETMHAKHKSDTERGGRRHDRHRGPLATRPAQIGRHHTPLVLHPTAAAEDYYRVDPATGLPVIVRRCPSSCGATEKDPRPTP